MLTDDSPMPFGKFRGERMGDVSAEYLFWLWENGVWQNKGQPVHEYIKANWRALEMDAPDFICTHLPK